MKYFDLTKTGRSVWWSWILGTWIALIIWVIGQSFLFGIIQAISFYLDPELETQFTFASQSMIANENFEAFRLFLNLSSWLGMAAILGTIITLVLSHQNSLKSDVIAQFGSDNSRSEDKITTVFAMITVIAIILAAGLYIYANRYADDTELLDFMQQMMGLSPITYGLFLLTFPAGCLGLYLVQKFVHKRSLKALHTAWGNINWWRIFEGFLITVFVLGGFVFIGSKLGFVDVRLTFNAQAFWGFALVSLLLIPLQSGTEEIVFRGYFNQGLMHFVKNKWIVFSITSLGFMALHLSNPEALDGAAAGNLPIVMSGYFFFGFAMCLLVWIDDGLESAIGVHAGNNCFAAILVNYEGSVLPTPSVFLSKPDVNIDSIATIVTLAVIVGIIWWRRGGPSRSNDTQSTGGA